MSTYETPIPNTPEYLQAIAMAQQAYQQALAQILHARSGTLRDAGYLDAGKGRLEIDPNNLYGGIQSLFRQHAINSTQQNLNYAGRGLMGGVRAGALADIHQAQAGETSKFGQQLDEQMSNYENQQQLAQQQYDNAVWAAQQQALQQALLQQLFNPAPAPAPPDPTSAISAATTSTQQGVGPSVNGINWGQSGPGNTGGGVVTPWWMQLGMNSPYIQYYTNQPGFGWG